MFEFSSLLMQSEIIDASTGLIGAIALLMSTASGIIVYALNRHFSASKSQMTEEERKRREAEIALAQGVMLASQKVVENIGEFREGAKIIYEEVSGLTPEQRKKIDEKWVPLLNDTSTRLQVGNEQIEGMKNKLITIIGENADVNKDSSMRREDSSLSTRLRKVNP
jgi:hypothetical protein